MDLTNLRTSKPSRFTPVAKSSTRTTREPSLAREPTPARESSVPLTTTASGVRRDSVVVQNVNGVNSGVNSPGLGHDRERRERSASVSASVSQLQTQTQREQTPVVPLTGQIQSQTQNQIQSHVVRGLGLGLGLPSAPSQETLREEPTRERDSTPAFDEPSQAPKKRQKRLKVAPLPVDLNEEDDDNPANPPPNPAEVISNLTLHELIDGFEGSVPSSSSISRSIARKEKGKLKKLQERRKELLGLGISLPPHLRNLPPDSDNEDSGSPAPTKRLTPFDVPSTAATPLAPQLRLVNGQLQIDESTLFVSLHTPLASGPAIFSSVSKHITSSTYMRRKSHSEKWTAQETTQFYECLTYFGTDFSMIQKCFPKRDHRAVKSKYLKEERESPSKVKEALKERRKIGRARFEEMSSINVEEVGWEMLEESVGVVGRNGVEEQERDEVDGEGGEEEEREPSPEPVQNRKTRARR